MASGALRKLKAALTGAGGAGEEDSRFESAALRTHAISVVDADACAPALAGETPAAAAVPLAETVRRLVVAGDAGTSSSHSRVAVLHPARCEVAPIADSRGAGPRDGKPAGAAAASGGGVRVEVHSLLPGGAAVYTLAARGELTADERKRRMVSHRTPVVAAPLAAAPAAATSGAAATPAPSPLPLSSRGVDATGLVRRWCSEDVLAEVLVRMVAGSGGAEAASAPATGSSGAGAGAAGASPLQAVAQSLRPAAAPASGVQAAAASASPAAPPAAPVPASLRLSYAAAAASPKLAAAKAPAAMPAAGASGVTSGRGNGGTSGSAAVVGSPSAPALPAGATVTAAHAATAAIAPLAASPPHPGYFDGLRIAELGAGQCGLAGMVLARLARGAFVLLTDGHAEAARRLAAHVLANGPIAAATTGSVLQSDCLVWDAAAAVARARAGGGRHHHHAATPSSSLHVLDMAMLSAAAPGSPAAAASAAAAFAALQRLSATHQPARLAAAANCMPPGAVAAKAAPARFGATGAQVEPSNGGDSEGEDGADAGAGDDAAQLPTADAATAAVGSGGGLTAYQRKRRRARRARAKVAMMQALADVLLPPGTDIFGNASVGAGAGSGEATAAPTDEGAGSVPAADGSTAAHAPPAPGIGRGGKAATRRTSRTSLADAAMAGIAAGSPAIPLPHWLASPPGSPPFTPLMMPPPAAIASVMGGAAGLHSPALTPLTPGALGGSVSDQAAAAAAAAAAATAAAIVGATPLLTQQQHFFQHYQQQQAAAVAAAAALYGNGAHHYPHPLAFPGAHGPTAAGTSSILGSMSSLGPFVVVDSAPPSPSSAAAAAPAITSDGGSVGAVAEAATSVVDPGAQGSTSGLTTGVVKPLPSTGPPPPITVPASRSASTSSTTSIGGTHHHQLHQPRLQHPGMHAPGVGGWFPADMVALAIITGNNGRRGYDELPPLTPAYAHSLLPQLSPTFGPLPPPATSGGFSPVVGGMVAAGCKGGGGASVPGSPLRTSRHSGTGSSLRAARAAAVAAAAAAATASAAASRSSIESPSSASVSSSLLATAAGSTSAVAAPPTAVALSPLAIAIANARSAAAAAAAALAGTSASTAASADGASASGAGASIDSPSAAKMQLPPAHQRQRTLSTTSYLELPAPQLGGPPAAAAPAISTSSSSGKPPRSPRATAPTPPSSLASPPMLANAGAGFRVQLAAFSDGSAAAGPAVPAAASPSYAAAVRRGGPAAASAVPLVPAGATSVTVSGVNGTGTARSSRVDPIAEEGDSTGYSSSSNPVSRAATDDEAAAGGRGGGRGGRARGAGKAGRSQAASAGGSHKVAPPAEPIPFATEAAGSVAAASGGAVPPSPFFSGANIAMVPFSHSDAANGSSGGLPATASVGAPRTATVAGSDAVRSSFERRRCKQRSRARLAAIRNAANLLGYLRAVRAVDVVGPQALATSVHWQNAPIAAKLRPRTLPAATTAGAAAAPVKLKAREAAADADDEAQDAASGSGGPRVLLGDYARSLQAALMDEAAACDPSQLAVASTVAYMVAETCRTGVRGTSLPLAAAAATAADRAASAAPAHGDGDDDHAAGSTVAAAAAVGGAASRADAFLAAAHGALAEVVASDGQGAIPPLTLASLPPLAPPAGVYDHSFDLIIGADTLFFESFHADQLFAIYTLLRPHPASPDWLPAARVELAPATAPATSQPLPLAPRPLSLDDRPSPAQAPQAWLLAPRRGGSLERFVALVNSGGFGVTVQAPECGVAPVVYRPFTAAVYDHYDPVVDALHARAAASDRAATSAVAAAAAAPSSSTTSSATAASAPRGSVSSPAYDADIHYPLLVALTLVPFAPPPPPPAAA